MAAKPWVIIGMKHAGKSTISRRLAALFDRQIIETDQLIEKAYENHYGESLSCREISLVLGQSAFRQLETEVLEDLAANRALKQKLIIDLGGGAAINEANAKIIAELGLVIWVKLDLKKNLEWILASGIPSFFADRKDPQKSFELLVNERFKIYEQLAAKIFTWQGTESLEVVDQRLKELLSS
jgi:shikimate kinase